MPDIFTNDSFRPIKTKGSDTIQPVREATPLLVGKIVFALLIPLLLYIFIRSVSLEASSYISFVESSSFDVGLLMFLFTLSLMQIIFVVLIVLQWKNHVYYLTENYIQENKGILTITEKMYDVKNIRDISVRQGILGRMWDFGDIVIESTAPGFKEELIIFGAPNPHEHEAFLEKLI